jgi:hypothetical protein
MKTLFRQLRFLSCPPAPEGEKQQSGRWITKPSQVLRTILGLLLVASFARAQDGFLSSWEERARATLAGQPAWPTPLVTANSGLVQLFRADFVKSRLPKSRPGTMATAKAWILFRGTRRSLISRCLPTSNTIRRPSKMALAISACS